MRKLMFQSTRRVLYVFLGLWLGLQGSTACARDTGEFGLQVVDVANKYTSALLAAKVCDQYRFANTQQEQRFVSNHETAKMYAARIFIEENPGVPFPNLMKKAESMDATLINDIEVIHKSDGCSNSLLATFLKWFSDLKDVPQQPRPSSDSDYTEYTAEAKHWLSLHPRD